MSKGAWLAGFGWWMSAGVFLLFVMVGVTGFGCWEPMIRQESTVWLRVHSWAAHLLVIGTLLAVAICLAAFIQEFIAQRRWFALASRSSVSLLVLALVLHTSFTGFLGPTRSPGISAANLIRFKVIHLAFEPFLLAVCQVWSWFQVGRLWKTAT